MKKLLSLFATEKPKNLKDFQKMEIPDKLIRFDFPNVGNYDRVKKPNTNEFRSN